MISFLAISERHHATPFYLSPDEALRAVHGDGPDGVLPQVLGHLEDQLGLPLLDDEGVEDLGEALLELDVHDGADDRHDLDDKIKATSVTVDNNQRLTH